MPSSHKSFITLELQWCGELSFERHNQTYIKDAPEKLYG